MTRVILVDDHQIVRNGLRLVLEGDESISVIGEAGDGQEALTLIEEVKPDVVLLDIRMPEMTGLDITSIVKQKFPSTKVLILTMHDDSEYVLKSVNVGADGYILKDTDKAELLKAVHTVHDGHKYFSGDISETLINSFQNAPSTTDSPVARVETSYNLTKREFEILGLIREGISNKGIAERLGKSVRTIETHRFNIMKKLKVNNVAELLNKVNKEQVI